MTAEKKLAKTSLVDSADGAQKYPPDEFDTQSKRVPAGAHRKPVRRWQAYLPIIAILVLGPLLAWGAAVFIKGGTAKPIPDVSASASPSIPPASALAPTPVEQTPSEAPAESKVPESTAPPSKTNRDYSQVSVSVRNLTNTRGLAKDKAKELNRAGFKKAQASHRRGGGIKQSIVVYRDDSAKEVAEEVAKTLGIEAVSDGKKFHRGSLEADVTVFLR